MSILTVFVRLSLAAVWLTAAYGKLNQSKRNAEVVRQLLPVPDKVADVSGALLPYVELTLGVLLLAGLETRVAASASLILLLMFSALMVIHLLRGSSVECHCFGSLGSSKISWWTLIRNVILTLCALLVAMAPAYRLVVEQWAPGSEISRSAVVEYLLAVCTVGALIALIMMAVGQIRVWCARTKLAMQNGRATGLRAFATRIVELTGCTVSTRSGLKGKHVNA